MKTPTFPVLLALLCAIGTAGPAHADSSLIDSFDNQTSLANWQPASNVQASLETGPKYIRVGTGSLKVVMRLDRATILMDAGLNVTNSNLQVSGTPSGISFWVYPVNTDALSIYAIENDGNGATWDIVNLKMDQWNLVRLFAKNAAMDQGGASATLNGIKRLSIGAGRVTTWLAIKDPDQPAVCYIDDLRAMNSDIVVDPYISDAKTSGNEVGDSLEMLQECWEGQPIEGKVTLRNPPGAGRGELKVSVLQGGNVVCSLVRPGVLAFRFCIIKSLPEGDYDIRITWDGPDEMQRFTVLGKTAIVARRKAVEASSADLKKMIAEAKSQGKPASYSEAAWAVADRFLRVESPDKIADGKLDQAGVDMERCEMILTQTIERLKHGKEPEVPAPSMEHLTVRDGSFYSGNTPVALLGPVGWSQMWQEMANVYELGFNFADDESQETIGEFQATMRSPGTWGSMDAFFDPERAYPMLNSWKLLSLENINIALSFNPGIWYVPSWVEEAYPETKPDGTWRGEGFNAPMESQAMRKLWAIYYQGIVSLTKDDPHLLLYWLKNEPTYWSHSHTYQLLFRDYLQKKYDSIAALNKVWKTTYSDFQQVDFPEASNKAAWYDWNCFHFDQVTDFFAWQRNQVKEYDPQAFTCVKPVADSMYDEAFTDGVGIDYEALANLYEVPGCDTYVCYSYQNPTGWLVRTGTLLYDFWKSIASSKPIANLEFHYGEENPPVEYYVDRDQIVRYVQTVYWQQYFHGARLNAFWTWKNSQSGRYASVPGQPTELYATSKVALDLRRLSKYISLFPGQSEVEIYYSKPSVFLDGPSHLGTLNDVYTSLFFLDAPIGFVTDKMVLKGIDKGTKFLIIPQAQYVTDDVYRALEDFAKGGGKLIIVGQNSLSMDEKNQPRDISSLKALPNVRWMDAEQTLNALWQIFNQIMDENGVKRPVRVTDDAGNPVWEIESRTVESNGKRLTYLINMSRENKEIHLKATAKIHHMKDLISDEPVKTETFTLKSFEVKFLEIQ